MFSTESGFFLYQVLKSQILLKMAFLNSIQLKMIKISTVSRTQEVIKVDLF